MSSRKKQSVLNGALILLISTLFVKVIGIVYKIPLTALIGGTGRGFFSSAYNIYTPIYAISMAGLPVAVSRMVSENTALHRYRDVRMIFRVSLRLFVITGILGTVVMLLVSYPYATVISHMPDALPSIIVVAPSILFCCIMSAYRGYYEGLSNMMPTALSQVIEALCKMVAGLVMAYAIMKWGLNQFAASGVVFGARVANKTEALSVIYPYTAAGAIGGVTAGTIIGLVYLIIMNKIKGDGFTKEELKLSPKPASGGQIARMLISIAIPVVASSLIQNVTNLIDAATIQNRLAYAINLNMPLVKSMYSASLTASKTLDKDIAAYLYGCYGAALDFKNLVPSITMSLGISALPALASAWAVKNKRTIKVTVESVLRVVMLISLPAGFGMAILATPILTLIYGSTQRDIIAVTAPVMEIYGYATALMSISGPMTNMLQAIGRADVPLKSLIIGAVAKMVANFILVGMPSLNINGAPYGSVICYIVIVGYNLFFLCKEAHVIPNIVSVFIKPLVSSIMCGIAAWASYNLLYGKTHFLNSSAATLAAIVIAVFVYVLALLLIRAISKDDIIMLPKGEKIAKLLEKYNLIG